MHFFKFYFVESIINFIIAIVIFIIKFIRLLVIFAIVEIIQELELNFNLFEIINKFIKFMFFLQNSPSF